MKKLKLKSPEAPCLPAEDGKTFYTYLGNIYFEAMRGDVGSRKAGKLLSCAMTTNEHVAAKPPNRHKQHS